MTYAVKLESFEGPLDLLLHLIAKAQVDIKDIFVSEITDQYLSYLEQMEQLDMEQTTEFLTMAATLLNIKSRSLLPKPEKVEEDEDPEALLILQLEEYKRIKQVSDTLHEMEAHAAKSYYKLPEEYAFQDDPLNLEGVSVESLYDALQELLAQKKEAEQRPARINVIRAELYTVRHQIAHVRAFLSKRGRMRFDELFAIHATRNEIIATFLALLELISAGEAGASQNQRYGAIEIVYKGKGKEEKA